MRRALLALSLTLAGPAFGQSAPVVQATRDVDVTYRVPVPGATDTYLLQRFRWSAAHRRQRLDLPTSGNWMVLDYNAHRLVMVRDDTHEVVDLPSPRSADQPGAGAGYAQAGPATVASLPCTEWRTVDTRGEETLACYTADGVLLRATSGSRVLMEAVHVNYAPQPDSVFEIPQGYTRQHSDR